MDSKVKMASIFQHVRPYRISKYAEFGFIGEIIYSVYGGSVNYCMWLVLPHWCRHVTANVSTHCTKPNAKIH